MRRRQAPAGGRAVRVSEQIHHELAERLQGKKRGLFSLSVEKCVERARRELAGRRVDDDELAGVGPVGLEREQVVGEHADQHELDAGRRSSYRRAAGE